MQSCSHRECLGELQGQDTVTHNIQLCKTLTEEHNAKNLPNRNVPLGEMKKEKRKKSKFNVKAKPKMLSSFW